MIRVLLVLVAWISISLANTNQAIGLVRVAAIRISFQEDSNPGTTGNGSFLYSAPIDTCGKYTIDPVPHDRSYFESQLLAVSNYFKSVSYNKRKYMMKELQNYLEMLLILHIQRIV